jgi:hypothetical protein
MFTFRLAENSAEPEHVSEPSSAPGMRRYLLLRVLAYLVVNGKYVAQEVYHVEHANGIIELHTAIMEIQRGRRMQKGT